MYNIVCVMEISMFYHGWFSFLFGIVLLYAHGYEYRVKNFCYLPFYLYAIMYFMHDTMMHVVGIYVIIERLVIDGLSLTIANVFDSIYKPELCLH